MSHINQYTARGPSWAVAMADCGAYVVIVDRSSWFGGLQKWGADVMAIYHQLIPDPTIDAAQIYLYGASAETPYTSKLVEAEPGLWKGVILMNPTGLPDLSAIPENERLPKILISAGAKENEGRRFKRFQENACGRGIPVEIEIAPDSRHFFVSTTAVRQRIRAMVDFVFEN